MINILANDGISKSGENALKNAGFNISTITVAQEQLIKHIQKENIEVVLVRSATTIRKDLIDQLESEKICRINRSYAINLSEIINIDNWHIKLNKSETSFFVQESYRSSFEKFIKKI